MRIVAAVLVLGLVVLAGVIYAFRHKHDPAATLPQAPPPSTQRFNGDLYHYSPFELLAYLKTRPINSEVYLEQAPTGWIKPQHLGRLVELMDSRTRCAGVHHELSSTIDDRPSTIGSEAASLIEGYRTGSYPPDLNSPRVHSAPQIDELKKWYRLTQFDGSAGR